MAHTYVKRLVLAKWQRMVIILTIPIVSAGLTFAYIYFFVQATPAVPAVIMSQEPQQETAVAVSPPARIRIPSISVDTTIKPFGLTADGDMDIDDNPDTVAWYKFGPKPGQKGSAVIAGHYGWKDGHGSIFNNLNTLKAGDKISVENEEGVLTNFIIRDVRVYNPEADATTIFKSTDAKAHLNLITCIGTWVNANDSYSDRLVVFSDLE